MNDDSYNISEAGNDSYEFISIGKKELLKRVIFSKMDYPDNTYNLALATVVNKNSLDFEDKSNNGDIVKVFSTIIVCVSIYTDKYPDRIIFFKGNTNQKTKIYNEILKKHFKEFSKIFNIFGMIIDDDEQSVAEEFKLSKNYSGFFIKKK